MVKHYAIERALIQKLHKISQDGKSYGVQTEINAFLTIANVLGKEAQEHLRSYRNRADFHERLKILLKKTAEEEAESKALERLAVIGDTASLIGHDMRNPLQSIVGELFLIKQAVGIISQNEVRQAISSGLNSIDGSISYINKIVSDLQDYTRTLKPEIREVDLSELLKAFAKTLRSPRIKVRTRIAENIKLNSDPSYLIRILENLANNALQAMPEGGRLTISAQKKLPEVIISVADVGAGISDDVKSKLFKPMFTTKAKGQGLGLAVAKRLTEALNGKITFESHLGKGTTFTISLPVPQNIE